MRTSDPKQLTDWLLDQIGFTEESAQNIADEISTAFKTEIQSGKVTPGLKQATIKRKKFKGFGKPEAPLYATGQMSESLELGEHSKTRIEIISTSDVNPLWHLRGTRNLPEREVLSMDKLDEIVRSNHD